jgi:L-ascorbate metabolism protein UlaG (beta-lactamase superfamily)
MDAEFTYLHHSSFAVKTAAHVLIFDYYFDTPSGGGLSQGVVRPADLREDDVVVFVSHHHPDHYSPRIFGWRAQLPHIRYVISDDVYTRENILSVAPGQSYDLGDMTVCTLKSTDIGVAFLISIDGLRIYHAGDLNWWKWEENSAAENGWAERAFQKQIDTLRGERVDLAFLPFDPRQGDDAWAGFDYFMRTVSPKYAVPMHSFGETEFFDRLGSDPRAKDYRGRILRYRARGETIRFSVPEE